MKNNEVFSGPIKPLHYISQKNAIPKTVFENRIVCDDEPFLIKQEVASLLRVSVKTIDRWVSMDTIPFQKAGNRVLFKKSTILEWMEGNSKE